MRTSTSAPSSMMEEMGVTTVPNVGEEMKNVTPLLHLSSSDSQEKEQ